VDGTDRFETNRSLGLPSRHDVAGVPVRDEVLSPPADTDLTRRTALKLMSASTLLALGGAGCTRKPARKIVSAVDGPEYRKPGIPLYYASTWTEGTWPYGLMIKTLEGRPVKIEGLPDHPLNRGTSSAAMQASLLSLYDPDRLRSPMRGDADVTWEEADREILATLRSAQSAVIVTRASLGPSERAMIDRFRQSCPGARHFVHEVVHDGPRRKAWRKLYGVDGILTPVLLEAKVILSLDSDLLGTDGDALTAIREFATRRVVDGDPEAKSLTRLYVAESSMTVTGSNADHRFPLPPSAAFDFVEALRKAVAGDPTPLAAYAEARHLDGKALAGLASDLRANRGASVALAGPHLPEAVHASIALLNAEIGALGKTLEWNPAPPTLPVSDPAEIGAAFEAEPDVALLLGVNPVYDWPGGGFERLLNRARLSVGHGLTRNETLRACRIALPSAHNLESWNDAVPRQGMVSVCQPMIAPLFGGRQEAESLLLWTKGLAPDDPELAGVEDWHDFVRGRWARGVLAGASEPRIAWEDALRKGFAGSWTRMMNPGLLADEAKALVAAGPSGPTGGDGAFELVILPHPTLLDGRFGGNAWLLELPDPASRLVWDNAVVVGPRTAATLGVEEGDWITIRAEDRTLDLPVLVQPGTAPGVLVTTLGWGRTAGAGLGEGHGVNVAGLLGGGPTPHLATGVSVTKGTDRPKHRLVRTQKEFSQHGRGIVLDGTREEYLEDSGFVRHRRHVPKLDQLDAPWDYTKGHKWAMAIDLGACVGCEACTIACQAENNIPSVGKEECGMGREMSWIRIDRYHDGDPENPTVSQQPMLCQHCDNAPCENVCPVNATAHSPEGLNEQVYNRCVGTRYCLNNCPYKVRRFNFLAYTKHAIHDPVQELLFNPQVTVRSRGVMEKCTFCVQRINAAKFAAENETREVRDGEVRTACQQACPARAIHFGDVNDPKSEIARKRASDLAYFVLEELNVRPNVSYLARVRNPHPDAAPERERPSGGGHG